MQLALSKGWKYRAEFWNYLCSNYRKKLFPPAFYFLIHLQLLQFSLRTLSNKKKKNNNNKRKGNISASIRRKLFQYQKKKKRKRVSFSYHVTYNRGKEWKAFELKSKRRRRRRRRKCVGNERSNCPVGKEWLSSLESTCMHFSTRICPVAYTKKVKEIPGKRRERERNREREGEWTGRTKHAKQTRGEVPWYR